MFNPRKIGLLAQVMIAFAVAAMFATVAIAPAEAATPNYATNIPVSMAAFHVSGQYTATTTSVIKFKLPFKAKLIGATATARASGGTSPTLTYDVLVGGSSILSAPVSITAGTVAEATISTSTIADESTVSVDFTIGGTSPTWNDMTVILTFVRL